jgi:hypothetical protein
MKLPGFLKPNDDPQMQPVVCENRGRVPVRLTSFLEAARPDLEEYDEDRAIVLWPGKRTVVPHGYYQGEVMGKGEAQVIHHFGDRAPELKGYSKPYRAKLIRPWYKKMSDFFSRG